jgi:hypothetical protein
VLGFMGARVLGCWCSGSRSQVRTYEPSPENPNPSTGAPVHL